GRAFAHLTLALPVLALYLIVLPHVYGLPALGRPAELFAMAAPFILAVSLLGQTVGARFRNPETAVLLLIAMSLPLFFLVGFAWPRDAIPQPVLDFASIFPSEFGIDGLVRVNQTGASLHEAGRDWHALWFLAGLYFVLAVVSARFYRKPLHG